MAEKNVAKPKGQEAAAKGAPPAPRGAAKTASAPKAPSVRFGIRLKFSLAIISLVAVVIASISAFFLYRESELLRAQTFSFVTRELGRLYVTAQESIGVDDLAIEAAVIDLESISVIKNKRQGIIIGGRTLLDLGKKNITYVKYVYILNDAEKVIRSFDKRGIALQDKKLDDGVPRRINERNTTDELLITEVAGTGEIIYDFSRNVLNKLDKRKIGTVIIGLSDEIIRNEILGVTRIIIPIALGMLGLSIIGAVVLATITIRPVRELSRGAAIIGGGNLDHRIAIKSSDELGQLAREFNQMTAEIKNARDREIESRILEEQMEMAKEIQEGLNPMGFYNRNGIQIKGHTKAAKGVGGDYFDYIQIDENRIGALISDVSGKGVPASLVMVMIRTVFTTLIKDKDIDCAKIVTAINNALSADFAIDKFATLFFMIYDRSKNELTFSNAGHGPLVCWRALKQAVATYKLDGVPIGIAEMEEDETYLQARVPIEPGDIVILNTDGVTEMRNEQQEEFTFKRVQKFMIENRDLDANAFVLKLVDELERFRGTEPPHDDTTMLVFKRIE